MPTRVYVSGIVEKDNKILILKRADTARFAAGQWEFVNGSIRENETAEETIERELKEETGLEVTNLTELPTFEVNDTDGRWVVVPYLVTATGDVGISQEHTEFRWVEADEIEKVESLKDEWIKVKDNVKTS